MESPKPYGLWSLPVIVAALGFFVDVYDLLLFSIVRKSSLADLGLSPEEIFTQGEKLISIQMLGLLIGGILWGIIGDKRGRLSVLFGSILLYSLANIANGFVQSTSQYAWLRLIAGIGLAGELGAGITLSSELLPKEKRGIAASLIASLGIMGAVTAFGVSRIADWRHCYEIGGAMGLLLLAMRIRVSESPMYQQMSTRQVPKGDFRLFFTSRRRAFRYLRCVMIGIPTWFIIGILVTFSDKFGEEFGISQIDPATSILFLYLALALGDLSAGLLSNYLKSRKKTLFVFYGITALFLCLYFLQGGGSAASMYLICAGLGYGAGFSVVYITMSAEQFGTNLRASAAVSIPNMVRGALPLILLLFQWLRSATGSYITGGWITALLLMAMALLSAVYMEESFGKDLDFLEE